MSDKENNKEVEEYRKLVSLRDDVEKINITIFNDKFIMGKSVSKAELEDCRGLRVKLNNFFEKGYDPNRDYMPDYITSEYSPFVFLKKQLSKEFYKGLLQEENFANDTVEQIMDEVIVKVLTFKSKEPEKELDIVVYEWSKVFESVKTPETFINQKDETVGVGMSHPEDMYLYEDIVKEIINYIQEDDFQEKLYRSYDNEQDYLKVVNEVYNYSNKIIECRMNNINQFVK